MEQVNESPVTFDEQVAESTEAVAAAEEAESSEADGETADAVDGEE